MTDAIRDFQDRLVVRRVEPDERRSIRFARDDLTAEGVARVSKGCTDGQLPAGLDEAAPRPVIAGRTEEEALDLPAARTLCVEPRRNNGGVVAKNPVASVQKTRQLGECGVFSRMRGAIDDEQARLIAAGGGGLRDQVRGQIVVEKFGGERRHMARGSGRRWSQQSDLNR